jgi:hypothetical protein
MNDRYYITYSLDGAYGETDALFNKAEANKFKVILEEDGYKNVEIVKYNSVLD